MKIVLDGPYSGTSVTVKWNDVQRTFPKRDDLVEAVREALKTTNVELGTNLGRVLGVSTRTFSQGSSFELH